MPRKKSRLNLSVGRPFISIDWEIVNQYIQSQCSGPEIASALGIHPDTLYARCEQEKGTNYSEYASNVKKKGPALIKVKQMSKALKGEGDTKMLIYLGKNYCGQSENPVVITERGAKIDEFLDILKGLKVSDTAETVEKEE